MANRRVVKVEFDGEVTTVWLSCPKEVWIIADDDTNYMEILYGS